MPNVNYEILNVKENVMFLYISVQIFALDPIYFLISWLLSHFFLLFLLCLYYYSQFVFLSV